MDNFVKSLIEEVKSQGVFDEFRFNCCLADVDTKPAYQNVRNRVETAVHDFLAKQHWTPDTNKVQLRERLRKHLLDSDVLEKGVDHIVDQVVNPKVATVFEPKIESIAYKFLGITPPPPPAYPPPRPPLLPAPPLPYAGHTMGHMNGGNILQVETIASLLPTDLEQISPDSDRATFKSDMKDDSKDDELPPGVDDDDMDYEDPTSPAFEPAASFKNEANNGSLNTSDSLKDVKELASDSRDAGASQASQLSQVSSDSRLTIASTEAQQPMSAINSGELTSNMAANMSEEAQMPRFNENSSEANESSGRHLHFDIKQDAITFEGTERRSSLSENANGGTPALSIEDAIMSEVKANISVALDPTPESQPRPELDSVAIKAEQQHQQPDNTLSLFSDSTQNSQNLKDSLTATPKLSDQPEVPEIKQELTKPDEAKAPEVAPPTLPAVPDEIKSAELTTSPASASSSSQTKKSSHSRDKDKDKRHHSGDKQRTKSRDRERDREQDKSRSKASSSTKHSSRSSHSGSTKHRSSSSKHDKSSSTRSNHESSASSSKRSSTHHDSSSGKKHKSSSSSSRSERDRTKSRECREQSHSHSHSHSHHSRSHNGSGSSSSTSRRSDRDRDRDRERNKSSSNSTPSSNSASNSINPPAATAAVVIVQDDHNEVKAKLQKRHSHDSNDEGKPPGAYGKSAAETATESQTKEKATDSSPQNGKATEETNGTNGTNSTVDDVVNASNVVVVSDLLQQSTASFIELSSASIVQKQKAAEEQTKPELGSKSAPPAAESTKTAALPVAVERVVEREINMAIEPEISPPAEPDIKISTAAKPTEKLAMPVEEDEVKNSSFEETLPGEPQRIPAEPREESNSAEAPAQPAVADYFTHFEESAEEFALRLQLIEQHIKDRRTLLNAFCGVEDTRTPRRNSAKRRLSSEASSSKQHSSSSASTNSSSSSPNGKTKRTRHDDVKTSPTPSEISVNSKENEDLGKHDKGDLSTRRLSQKLCQQQRYTNDDLYKPRPLLSQRSRRRGLDAIL